MKPSPPSSGVARNDLFIYLRIYRDIGRTASASGGHWLRASASPGPVEPIRTDNYGAACPELTYVMPPDPTRVVRPQVGEPRPRRALSVSRITVSAPERNRRR